MADDPAGAESNRLVTTDRQAGAEKRQSLRASADAAAAPGEWRLWIDPTGSATVARTAGVGATSPFTLASAKVRNPPDCAVPRSRRQGLFRGNPPHSLTIRVTAGKRRIRSFACHGSNESSRPSPDIRGSPAYGLYWGIYYGLYGMADVTTLTGTEVTGK